MVCLGNSRKEAIKAIKNFTDDEWEVYEQLEYILRIPKKGITMSIELTDARPFNGQISLTSDRLPNPDFKDRASLEKYSALLEKRITAKSPKALAQPLVSYHIKSIVPFIGNLVKEMLILMLLWMVV